MADDGGLGGLALAAGARDGGVGDQRRTGGSAMRGTVVHGAGIP